MVIINDDRKNIIMIIIIIIINDINNKYNTYLEKDVQSPYDS